MQPYNLDKVTLTGADDNVSIETLINISKEYPFVEWGILLFPEKEGTARNPSTAWRRTFLQEALYAYPPVNKSVHLCGEVIFRRILEADPKTLTELKQFSYVQVNINARNDTFTNKEIVRVYRTLLDIGCYVIAQYHDKSKDLIELFLNSIPNDEAIAILLDQSKGKGVKPEKWYTPNIINEASVNCGYAGGLNPENLDDELPKILQSSFLVNNPFPWIDMETGIRTDNQFDLDKVRAVLEIAKPYTAFRDE